MQGVGISGVLLLILVIIVILYILYSIKSSAMKKLEFKKTVTHDLQKIKADIHNIEEILNSKDK